MFVTLADFKGEINISQNRYNNTNYDAIIAETEESVLKLLLGEDLYLKLIDDLDVDNVPLNTMYAYFLNGKTYSVYNEEEQIVKIDYKGAKAMLK